MFAEAESLTTLTVRYVVRNCDLYEKNNYLESLEVLPSNIKNKVLKVFTSCPGFVNKITLNSILAVLVNDKTTHVNLLAYSIDNNTLTTLAKCYNLRKLHINGKEGKFNAKGLLQALGKKNKLYFLTINNCDEVDDTLVQSIIKNCPRLKGLDLGRCTNVSDSALEAVSTSNISWLRLSYSKITDNGISLLVNGKCAQQLTELRIDHCENITSIGLSQIPKKCPNLTTINFSNCKTGDNVETLTDFLNFQSKPKQIFWQISW